MKTICIYFSPKGTTEKSAMAVAGALGGETERLDLLRAPVAEPRTLEGYDRAVLAAPVYAGRLPGIFTEQLRRLTAAGLPAVLLAVYGCRAYDDALAELQDLAAERGFLPVAAAASVAEHSIFPTIAAGRPNADDLAKLAAFGGACGALLEQGVPAGKLEVPGSRPYKTPGGVPFHPKGDAKCSGCGLCAEICPAKAIDKAAPRKTDGDRCISCGACIKVCPQGARDYHTPLYAVARAGLAKMCDDANTVETYFVK